MGMNKKQEDYIAGKFEELLQSPQEVGKLVKEQNESLYKEMANSAIHEKGFPATATTENVPHTFEMTTTANAKSWAERYIEGYDLQTNDEFEAMKDDVQTYTAVLMDNVNLLTADVTIQVELVEWLNEHPTPEYFKDEIEKNIDTKLLKELIPTHASDYEDNVRQAAIDDGFPTDIDISKLNVDLENVGYGETPDSLATRYLDSASQSGGVSSYMAGQFFMDILRDDNVSYEIKILSDIEDYQEE